jgi:hypothetical protein
MPLNQKYCGQMDCNKQNNPLYFEYRRLTKMKMLPYFTLDYFDWVPEAQQVCFDSDGPGN